MLCLISSAPPFAQQGNRDWNDQVNVGCRLNIATVLHQQASQFRYAAVLQCEHGGAHRAVVDECGAQLSNGKRPGEAIPTDRLRRAQPAVPTARTDGALHQLAAGPAEQFPGRATRGTMRRQRDFEQRLDSLQRTTDRPID